MPACHFEMLAALLMCQNYCCSSTSNTARTPIRCLHAQDVYKTAEAVKQLSGELGGKVVREPGPLPGLKTKITSVEDPDGWKVVFVDNKDFLAEL